MRKLLSIITVLFIFGCGDPYKQETEVFRKKDADSVFTVVNRVLPSIWTSEYCKEYKVKHPYSLIIWNDNTYGILFKDRSSNWYKVTNDMGREFTFIIGRGEHFKDSCTAKKSLSDFLESRVTFKEVK